MTFPFKIIVLITVIFPLNYEFSFCGCTGAEYEIDKRCCPMCVPGHRVASHCTDDTSTTCAPCPEFTYIDEPNGLTECFNCTLCKAERGLRENKACTGWSDAVCEPLESFFCTERIKDSCRLAVQHSECRPGQYIKQAGTSSTDTVCANCTAGTYSDGSFSSCRPHTKCEALGLTETHPGTQSSDSECEASITPPTVIALSVIVIFIIIVTSVFTVIHIQKTRVCVSALQADGLYYSVQDAQRVLSELSVLTE